MKNRKAVVIILTVVACAAVVLLSRWQSSVVQQHTPGMTEQEEHDTMQEDASADAVVSERVISESDLISAIQNSCAALSVEELSVNVSDNAVIMCSGTVSKESAAKLLKGKSDSITSAYESILPLLPDALPVEVSVQVSTQNGELCTEFLSMKIADMELPKEILASDICTSAEDSMADFLTGDFKAVQSVSVHDGQILLTGN